MAVNKLTLGNVPYGYNRQAIYALLAQVETLVNGLAEGRLTAKYNAQTAVPTTGEYQVGDVVYNATPSELGSASSKYILTGWMCVTSSPLAFRELRCLTGN